MVSSTVATPANILSRMVDTEHQQIQKSAFLLAYGDKGTRKTTTLVGLAQKLRGEGRILFVDSAEGFASLDRFPALKRNVHRVRLDDPRELMVISKALRTRAKGFEDFTVVVLDEYSSWWTDTLHSFAYEQAGLDPDRDELPIIDWTWYGPPQQAMMNVVKNFDKTPNLHVLIAAHEQGRAIKGESNGPDRYTPLLGTKLSAGIGQLAHVVARFESRKVGKVYQTECQIQPTRYVEAKSRMSNTNEMKLDSVTLVKTFAAWIMSDAAEDDIAGSEPATVSEEPVDEGQDEEFEVTDDEE